MQLPDMNPVFVAGTCVRVGDGRGYRESLILRASHDGHSKDIADKHAAWSALVCGRTWAAACPSTSCPSLSPHLRAYNAPGSGLPISMNLR